MYSSNIGSAKMAMDAGAGMQRSFLGDLGLLRRPEIELFEVGIPQVPDSWGDISTMTIAYGHGLAVSGLQLASGFSALVNGGVLHSATLLKVDPDYATDGESRRTRAARYRPCFDWLWKKGLAVRRRCRGISLVVKPELQKSPIEAVTTDAR